MKISFQIISVMFVCLLIGCNRVPDLTKDEVYKILNEIIVDDSLRLYTVCSKIDIIDVKQEYGFSDKDRKFINRQNKIFKKFEFEPNMLKSYSKKEKVFKFCDIDTSCREGIQIRLSFPLISQDRNMVLFEKTEDCHCMLGGQGRKDLYVKENGKWKNVKVFDYYISKNAQQPTKNWQ